MRMLESLIRLAQGTSRGTLFLSNVMFETDNSSTPEFKFHREFLP